MWNDMGMIANYQLLTDEQLKTLKKNKNDEEELYDLVEEWNEDADLLLDIDKMWEALHFVFTGRAVSETLEKDIFGIAVLGEEVLDTEDFIAYIEKSKIQEICDALETFDIESAMAKFSVQKCKEANLYPNIWDTDDEEEVAELKEELTDYYENMKSFYGRIAERKGNVLVTIY